MPMENGKLKVKNLKLKVENLKYSELMEVKLLNQSSDSFKCCCYTSGLVATICS